MAAISPVVLAGASLCVGAAHAAPATDAVVIAALDAVVVSANRTEQPVTDVVADVTVVDREAIDRSGAASVAEVLARLPGVSIVTNGGPASTTSVYLRGAETRFTAVFVDGVRVDSQSTGGASWQGIPLAHIERIEVLRGPAAAVYGSDAVAGVVQLFTRQGEEGFFPSVHAGVGTHHTHDLSASLRGGQGAVDYSLGLATERSDGFNAKPTGNPDRDGYRSHSVSGRLGWKPATGHQLNLTLLDSRQKGRYDGFTPGQDDQTVQELRTTGLNWSARWGDVWSTRLGLSRGTERYETAPSPYLTQTRVESYWLRNEWKLGGHGFNLDLERREDRLTNRSTTPSLTGRAQDALALGYTLRAGAHTLQANARRDDDSEFGVHTTGSLAYGHDLTPAWRATASVGTAFRAPTLFQRFSIYGTPMLQAETGRNVEAGLRWQSGQDKVGVVVYRNHVENLIDYISGPGSCINGTGTYPGCYGNVGEALYRGVTLTAATKLGALNLSGSVDWMDPRNALTDKRLPRRARRQATLLADTRWGGWKLGGELQAVGSRFDDAANRNELGGYTLINLSASTEIARDWTALARVNNLANKDYQTARGYATAGRTFYLGLTWAPR